MDTVFEESGPRISLALPPRSVLDNKYEIGRVLGKGGFGITYAAVDRNLNIPVAIKEFLPAQVAGRGTDQSTVQPHGGGEEEVFEHGLSAFLDEARTLAQFDHPNIVKVNAFFKENGTGYLVMPFYEGETLDGRLAAHGGPMPADEAVALLEPVMDGLEAVHARNILHRDIKPQNVYLTDTGKTVLLDFGAARIAFGQESQSLSAVLTPGYAPFEQYSRRGHQGTWTDVYATAAVLYRMLTGAKPPEATDRLAGEPLPPIHLRNPSVSPAIAAAVTAALEVHPKDRPPSIAAFRQMLGDGTVIVEDSPPQDIGGATGGASGGSGSGVRPGEALLVLHATRPCKAKLNTGDVLTMSAGEEIEIPVLPGEHVVTAEIGGRQFRTREVVTEGDRHVVRLAPSGRGTGRRGGKHQGDPPTGGGTRSGGVGKWIALGAAALLAILVIAVLASPNDDPVGGDDGEGAAAAAQPIQFQGPGIPFSTGGTLDSDDGRFGSGEFADVFEFQRGDARSLSADLRSSSFDAYLALRTPSGETLFNDDAAEGVTDASLFAQLDEPGTYRLFVTTYEPGESGAYTLTATAD